MERDEGFYRVRAKEYDIPLYMHSALVRYIVHGIPPGHFLSAVISDYLREAFRRADDTNKPLIESYLRFFYNEAPGECHGSPHKMDCWIQRGGLRGLPKAQAS